METVNSLLQSHPISRKEDHRFLFLLIAPRRTETSVPVGEQNKSMWAFWGLFNETSLHPHVLPIFCVYLNKLFGQISSSLPSCAAHTSVSPPLIQVACLKESPRGGSLLKHLLSRQSQKLREMGASSKEHSGSAQQAIKSRDKRNSYPPHSKQGRNCFPQPKSGLSTVVPTQC